MESTNIRMLRRQLGLTQGELAEAVGVDQGTVSRWERGVDAPRPARLAALRNLLGRERYGRAHLRQLAIVRANLWPATIVTADLKLAAMSAKGRAHFEQTRGLDVSDHIGRCFGFHNEAVGNPAFYELFRDRFFDPVAILMGHVHVNIRGYGSICVVEPLFRDDLPDGFLFYQGGVYAAAPSETIGVESAEVVPIDLPGISTSVYAARPANGVGVAAGQ